MKASERKILSELLDNHIQAIVNRVVYQIRRVPSGMNFAYKFRMNIFKTGIY